MPASRQVEITFFRDSSQQRGSGFGATAQGTGRTAIPIICNCVSGAKRAGVDLLELAAP